MIFIYKTNTRFPPTDRDDNIDGVRPHGHRAVQARAGLSRNYFTETCSGSEAGSYLRLIDCVYHSTLGLRVINNKVSPATASTPLSAGERGG